MFVVAEVEAKEHCLPSFSWSSNTILCVGVSSSECRLCILHSLEFPTPCCLQICSLKTLLSLLGEWAVESWSYLLLFGCLLYTSAFTPWRRGTQLACKNSKQMINIMLFKGSIRNTDGEDVLLLCVFTAPPASGDQWHQSRRWHELSRHHSMRAGSISQTHPCQRAAWPAAWTWFLGWNDDNFKSWKLPGVIFFLQDAEKLMFPVHSETLCQNCWCWGKGCHWQSNLLNTHPAARACGLEAAVHWKAHQGYKALAGEHPSLW